MIIGATTALNLAELASTMPDGCFVEVGVYRGGSAQYLLHVATEQGRQLFAYDTFTGLPVKGPLDPMNIGDFGDTDYEFVKKLLPVAFVVKGYFPTSAVAMPPVAFAHIDCDQYQCVKEAAQYLEPLMVKGGVMWFDDYGCLPGADAAVNELYAGRIEFAHPCGKAIVRF